MEQGCLVMGLMKASKRASGMIGRKGCLLAIFVQIGPYEPLL